MGIKKILFFFVILLVLSIGFGFQGSQDHKVLFEKAKFTMETRGDLQEAIKLFSDILEKFPDEREYAAQSQLYIGLCYEKLGLEGAQKAYQDVINNYPEQAEAVKVAKEKLAMLLKAQALIEKDEKEFRINPVKTFQEYEGFGIVSPDGKYISGTNWLTGDLIITEINTGKIRSLTKKKAWNEANPEWAFASRWSPDGKYLVYTWITGAGNTDLYIAGINSAESRILYKGKEKEWIGLTDWSQDGKFILTQNLIEKGSELGLISVKDGSVRTLKKLDISAMTNAIFSPDGRYIAYHCPQNKNTHNHDIFLLSIDGKREIPLITNPAHDYLMDWAPDGNNILFISNRTGTMDAWIIQVVKGKPKEAPQLVRRNIGLIEPLGITREGSFYYITPSLSSDIYSITINPSNGKIMTTPEKLPLSFEGSNRLPGWSPDGKKLVYISQRGPQKRQYVTCIYSLKTGKVRELTFYKNYGSPSWAPDGQSVFVQATVQSGQGIHRIDTQTGNITPFIQKGENFIYSPQVSKNGDWVIYAQDNKGQNNCSIIQRDLKTGKEKELARSPFDNHSIALSPDNKQLALLLRPEENLRVLSVMLVMGGEQIELHRYQQGGRWDISINWSPDGKYIYFSEDSDDDQTWELWRVPSKGGKAQKLGLKMQHFRHLSFHPDGCRLTFSSIPPKSNLPNVWVMENFLPTKKDKK